MPTQMPKNGRPLRCTASSSASTMPADRIEATPAIGEGADAGQHHAVRTRHHARILRHHDRLIEAGFMRRAFERLRGRMQIAGAVIDNSDAHRCAPGSGNRPMTPGVSDMPEIGAAGGAALRMGALPTQASKKRRSASSTPWPPTMPTLRQCRRSKRKAAQRAGFKSDQKRDQDADKRDHRDRSTEHAQCRFEAPP